MRKSSNASPVAALDVALDRPLPQNPDAERSVLGSALLRGAEVVARVRVLATNDFFKEAHRQIWLVMLELDSDGEPIDYMTVCDRLAARGELEAIGGRPYITSLTDMVPDVANAEKYAAIVKRHAQLRELLVIGNSLMRDALEPGARPDDVVADYSERMQLIRPGDALSAVLNVQEISRRVEELYEHGGVQKGYRTGWKCVDEFYRVQPGAWTLVTGIPGHGKSGFLDQMILNLAQLHNWQVVMFSAENYPPESHMATLAEKFVHEPFNPGPTVRMMPEVLRGALGFISGHIRFVDPAAERMTVDRILATASALALQRQVNVLTIDPWNELHHEKPDGLTETEYISVSLTKIRRWARRHDAHVFLVAHPSKMQKNRDSQKYDVPTPYDVSGSAHWRNKADYCIAIYRDITEGDDPNVQIHIQKVRRREMGRLGMAVLRYSKITSAYTDPQAPRRQWEPT